MRECVMKYAMTLRAEENDKKKYDPMAVDQMGIGNYEQDSMEHYNDRVCNRDDSYTPRMRPLHSRARRAMVPCHAR